jgi:hypothetical protein
VRRGGDGGRTGEGGRADLGPDADLVQAVVQANLPSGAGDFKFTAGKMPSMLGVEGSIPR